MAVEVLLQICQRCIAFSGLIGIGLALPFVSNAMQFGSEPLDNGRVAITATGPIIAGDMVRLSSIFGSLDASVRIGVFALDSPGGNVLEAEKLADVVRQTQAAVAVVSGATCASACFLIFAAGQQRLASEDALIGVHSSSIDGRETTDSMALTMALARDAAQAGVPASIIGKLVSTPPNHMEWLTQSDFAAMGVRLLGSAQPVAPQFSESRESSSAASHVPPRTADPVIQPQSFYEGARDRQAWEQWMSSLDTNSRNGAEYWATHRSDHNPEPCNIHASENDKSWLNACAQAKKYLSAVDVHRKSDPDYKRGWNSF